MARKVLNEMKLPPSRTRLDSAYVSASFYQNVSISKGSSEIAILVENVAGQPVSLNLGHPHLASTPPCWVNLHFSQVNLKLIARVGEFLNFSSLDFFSRFIGTLYIKRKHYCSPQFIAELRD